MAINSLTSYATVRYYYIQNRITSVSYTHLDVYKRQVLWAFANGWDEDPVCKEGYEAPVTISFVIFVGCRKCICLEKLYNPLSRTVISTVLHLNPCFRNRAATLSANAIPFPIC